MTKEYQVTLICATGKYKPVSCIVRYKQEKDADLSKNTIEKKKIINEGVKKICFKRYWTSADVFSKYNYTKVKVRLYDKEKIDAENKARYEAIKEKKYQTGEWKRKE